MVTRSHASDSDASYVLVPGGNSAGGAVPAAPTEQSPPLAEPPTTEPMEGALQASHESLSEAAATVEGTEPTAVTIGLPSLSSQLMGSEFGNFTQESSAPINHTCWFTVHGEFATSWTW